MTTIVFLWQLWQYMSSASRSAARNVNYQKLFYLVLNQCFCFFFLLSDLYKFMSVIMNNGFQCFSILLLWQLLEYMSSVTTNNVLQCLSPVRNCQNFLTSVIRNVNLPKTVLSDFESFLIFAFLRSCKCKRSSVIINDYFQFFSWLQTTAILDFSFF